MASLQVLTPLAPLAQFTIDPPVYDATVYYGMAILPFVVVFAWARVFSVGDSRRVVRLLLAAAVVMAISAVAATSGRLSDLTRTPPLLAVLMPMVAVLGLTMGLSGVGRHAMQASMASLVCLQSFRFPLELVMHRAAELGIMPGQLTWTGLNFDIVTGSGALLLCLLYASGRKVPRALVWGWNLVGIFCLAMIGWVAVTTAPMVRFYGDDPRSINSWVMYWPYVWLPIVLVSIAIGGHVVITRKLLARVDATAR